MTDWDPSSYNAFVDSESRDERDRARFKARDFVGKYAQKIIVNEEAIRVSLINYSGAPLVIHETWEDIPQLNLDGNNKGFYHVYTARIHGQNDNLRPTQEFADNLQKRIDEVLVAPSVLEPVSGGRG